MRMKDMLKVDKSIQNIDKTICDNIDLMDGKNVSRALIAQNLLGQSRNLVEHIAVKIYANGNDIDVDWDSITKAKEFIKRNNEYQFLREFHVFLQESKSHYTPDDQGAERLVLKYYTYYLMIRSFMKQKYDMLILSNLEKFPVDTDTTAQEYYEKISEIVDIERPIRDFDYMPGMYVHKIVPFIVKEKIYYEITLTPAFDTTSKYDRFICYSSIRVPSHYSIKADIYYDDILIHDRKIPISIITEFRVSIRPCELDNYARLLGKEIKMLRKHSEYIGMMDYLTISGVSLLDVVLTSPQEYRRIKTIMFRRSKVHFFEPVIDKSRDIILNDRNGANILRYLLHTLNNKVIKAQRDKTNGKLSGLCLKYECIPFDEMPFASSLCRHTPRSIDLFGSISSNEREHELLARHIQTNMCNHSHLYTPIKEIGEEKRDIDILIENFNGNLYEKHFNRRIEKFGQNLYIQGSFDNTKTIITKLQKDAQNGIDKFQNSIIKWLEENNEMDSEEKETILKEMFVKTCVTLIYGAAGTGKTYLINIISNFYCNNRKLFLANTNPAVENLRRKVNAPNSNFMTIKKCVMSNCYRTDYDILIIDECSMVSNLDMARVMRKINYKILILVGDTYQIESIDFGNWFSMAKYFIPRYAWNVLETPFRTKDKDLLELWKKVRNLDKDLTEYIVAHNYSENLGPSVYERKSIDEIILCLNYDGFYGINNINHLLQEDNPNKSYRWEMWTFKVGDPILFNESERFMPYLYNNLKGTIVDISLTENGECIWFSVEIEKEFTKKELEESGLELLEPQSEGKSIVKFNVKKKKELDDNNDIANETDIPFQIAYAVSIHKAQGLEYESVKVIITKEVDEMITHNIFYTAITRSKKYLKIYWSPESQNKIIEGFEIKDSKRDASIFAAQTGLKMLKIK